MSKHSSSGVDQTFRVSVPVAVRCLKYMLPVADLIFKVIEGNGGKTELPPSLINRLKLLKIERWADLYLEPQKIFLLGLLCTYSIKNIEIIGKVLQQAVDDAERVRIWDMVFEHAQTVAQEDDEFFGSLPDVLSPEDQQTVVDFLRGADTETRAEVGLRVQALLTSIFTWIYNVLSVMAYGQPITVLVDRAAKGDRQAYFKAYHVDRTVAEIPLFAEWHEQAKMNLDYRFFEALHAKRVKPLIPPSKIKYPKLWFIFAYLGSFGVLNFGQPGSLKQEELLDICTQLGVYGANYDKGVDDLQKRLQDYRKTQKALSSHQVTKRKKKSRM